MLRDRWLLFKVAVRPVEESSYNTCEQCREPPYSAGQESANDNNQNQKYPVLDATIESSYVKESSGANKNSLYDSYVRGIRWASNRIAKDGVIAFVSNGSFIDGSAADLSPTTHPSVDLPQLRIEYLHVWVLASHIRTHTLETRIRKHGHT